MNDKRVLVDTSVWIDYFRNAHPDLTFKVDLFLDNDLVAVPKIVLAELIQGAKEKGEIRKVREYFAPLHCLDQKESAWEEAGLLAFDLKKKGFTINLSDCYIALIARDNGCKVYSLDKHFSILGDQGVIETV